MNIAIFGRTEAEADEIYLRQLFRKLGELKTNLIFYKPYFEMLINKIELPLTPDFFTNHQDLAGKADFLFSIGGDGTLLDTIAFIRDSGIPVLGINLGRLGYLSSISKDETLLAIDKLFEGKYKLDKRTLLKVNTRNSLFGDFNYALNDLVITRKDSNHLVVTHVYVDDLYLNSYWADGLIVATPTGSTAYSLSSGGPILTPGSENFVITPIAAHNLTIRPIVISDKSKIRIRIEGRDRNFLVSLDSRTRIIDSDYELVVEKEDFKVNLVQIADKTFFSAIRDKLKWGLDIRN